MHNICCLVSVTHIAGSNEHKIPDLESKDFELVTECTANDQPTTDRVWEIPVFLDMYWTSAPELVFAITSDTFHLRPGNPEL